MEHIIQPFNAETVQNASRLLAGGELACFPTETVYALAADATNDAAVEKIYAAKQRDPGKPLSLLVKSHEDIRALCEVSPQAEVLIAAYMPGALTLVLPLKHGHPLSSRINKNEMSIGVRIPDHQGALMLLNAVPFPLVGTSANLSGMPPVTGAEDALAVFGNRVGIILAGETGHGVASTVVDLTHGTPEILREGTLSTEEIMVTLHAAR